MDHGEEIDRWEKWSRQGIMDLRVKEGLEPRRYVRPPMLPEVRFLFPIFGLILTDETL